VQQQRETAAPPPAHVIWGSIEVSTRSASDTTNASSLEGDARACGSAQRRLSPDHVVWDASSTSRSASNADDAPGLASRCKVVEEETEQDGMAEGTEQMEATDTGPEAPSVGSTNHEAGRCKPCLLVHSSLGCEAGEGCPFCHLTHTRRMVPRPSKGKRHRQQRLLSKKMEQFGLEEPRGRAQEAERPGIVSL